MSRFTGALAAGSADTSPACPPPESSSSITPAPRATRRTSPVMYHEEGDLIAVVASKAGQPTNPAWFHNLRANPETTIQIGSAIRDVRARVATDEEHDRLWPRFLEFYPGYDFFQELARDRKIPIVILDPR